MHKKVCKDDLVIVNSIIVSKDEKHVVISMSNNKD